MRPRGVRLLSSPSGRTTIVALEGDLDRESLPSLQAGLDLGYGTPARVLVVDLATVDVVHEESFAAMRAAHRDLARAGRDLVVVNVRPDVARQIRLLDVDHELRLVTLERVLSNAWDELGALRPTRESSST